MHFTASIHTGGHSPLSLHSRSGLDRIKRCFDQSVIGARVESDRQCELWPQSSYGSAGLEWGCVAGSLCLPRAYIMEMKKAQDKLKLERTMNGAKNVNARGFDRTVSRVWAEPWCESSLAIKPAL